MRIHIETSVAATARAALARFDRELFEALKPRGMRFEVLRFDGSRSGDEVHLRMGLPGMMMRWVSIITEEISGPEEIGFVDEGRVLPWFLKSWRHRHILREQPYGCDIIDDIEFVCPAPGLAAIVWPGMRLQFAGRGPVYRRIFGTPSF